MGPAKKLPIKNIEELKLRLEKWARRRRKMSIEEALLSIRKVEAITKKQKDGKECAESSTSVEIANTPIIADPITEAIRLARKFTSIELGNIESKIAKAVVSIAELEDSKNGLLPIENGLLPEIEEKKGRLSKLVIQLQARQKFGQFAEFSLEPFKWRDAQGFPAVVLFSLESPDFEIKVQKSTPYNGERATWSKSILPNLPKEIQSLFEDVYDTLRSMVKSQKGSRQFLLRASFPILIPPSVKEEILKVRDEFKDTFIVASVAEWSVGKSVRPNPNQNFLVVGYDGSNYWLITAFDKSSLARLASATVQKTSNDEIVPLSKKRSGKRAATKDQEIDSSQSKKKPGRFY